MKTNKKAGFTLIELMIVLVIIGIIMAYAIPTYNQYVLRSYRTDAQNAILLIASQQERFYANNNRYADDLTELGVAGVYPTPTAANGRRYGIVLEGLPAGAATSYTVTGTATNTQTADTECPAFTLNSIGTRTPGGNCW